jgi:hypothetical protein
MPYVQAIELDLLDRCIRDVEAIVTEGGNLLCPHFLNSFTYGKKAITTSYMVYGCDNPRNPPHPVQKFHVHHSLFGGSSGIIPFLKVPCSFKYL